MHQKRDRTVSRLTLGKIQLNPLENILKWDRRLLQDPRLDTILTMIREDNAFAHFITQITRGSALRLVEAVHDADGRYAQGRKRRRPRFSQARDVIYNLFSADQRGGGTRLCSQPLFELDPHKYSGLHAVYQPSREVLFHGDAELVPPVYRNPDRLSGFHVKVGRPYAEILLTATEEIADGIDRLSANLSKEVIHRMEAGAERIDVEDLTQWCTSRFWQLTTTANRGGRLISKVDFFLYPPGKLRAAALRNGGVDAELSAALRKALQRGGYHVSAFDISGGAAGVGKSEILARHWGFETSGLERAYADALLNAFLYINRRPPDQIIIMPSRLDLVSFASVEYLPLQKTFQERGFRTHIADSEAYQAELCRNPSQVRLHDVDGTELYVGGGVRTLIVRRYNYLNEAHGITQGIIPAHPLGTTVLPSDESRIVASNCQINLMLLHERQEAIRGRLDEDHGQRFKEIPFLFLRPDDARAPSVVSDFLASCADEWPEVCYLGGIVKPVDKLPPSPSGQFQPVFPIPAIPLSAQTVDQMVKPLFNNMIFKGVGEVVLMPNILPLIVDQNNRLLPKMEVRMIAIQS
jgi:hypothetical protein